MTTAYKIEKIVPHKCPKGTRWGAMTHYGHAITKIEWFDRKWWAQTGSEYGTAIKFCPFCGLKLEKP